MRKQMLVLLVLALFAASFSASSALAQESGGDVMPGEVRQMQFDAPTLFASRPYQYNVYLPAGYADSDTSYPVIYLLHGRGDDMHGWLNVKPLFDQMIASGEIPPMIAIMPDVPSLERASYYVDTQYEASGAQNEPVESLFFNDLLTHVDATYRTLPRRESRLVGGYSMGAFGAIRYALVHPYTFAGALVLSPAVYTPLPPVDSSAREFGAFGKGNEVFDEDVYTSLNYPAQLETLRETGLGIAMFIAVGDDEYHNPNPEDWLHDIDMEAHLLYNRVVRVPNVAAELRVYDGGHDWNVWERGFAEGMRFLAPFLSTSPDDDAGAGMEGTLLGTEGEDFAGGLATDADGNTYLALAANGSINGETAFGDLDAVLIKFDPDGTPLWTRQFGTPAADRPYGLALDSSGSVVVAGYTKGDLDGSHPANDADDAFVARFSPDGEPQWLVQFGDPAQADRAYALAIAPDDSIYLGGYTRGRLYPDARNLGDKDVFLARVSPTGELAQIQQFGGTGEDKGLGLAVAENGTVYLTGVWGGSLGQQTAYLAAYAPDGERLWNHFFGSADFDWLLNGVATSGDLIIVTGYASGEAEADQFAGDKDIFTAAFDPAGEVLWARQAGTPDSDVGAEVRIDENGRIVVVAFSGGDFAGSSGGRDVVLIEYDAAGSQTAIHQLGTPEHDGGDLYNEKNIFPALAGNTLHLSGFTTGSVGGVPSFGASDVFLTTLSFPG